MTTYTVREVLLSNQPLNTTTLPQIIAANDPLDGSVLAGILPTGSDPANPSTLLMVWAKATVVSAVS